MYLWTSELTVLYYASNNSAGVCVPLILGDFQKKLNVGTNKSAVEYVCHSA